MNISTRLEVWVAAQSDRKRAALCRLSWILLHAAWVAPLVILALRKDDVAVTLWFVSTLILAIDGLTIDAFSAVHGAAYMLVSIFTGYEIARSYLSDMTISLFRLYWIGFLHEWWLIILFAIADAVLIFFACRLIPEREFVPYF